MDELRQRQRTADDDDGQDVEQASRGDDPERELWLLQLDLCALQALDKLSLLKQVHMSLSGGQCA